MADQDDDALEKELADVANQPDTPNIYGTYGGGAELYDPNQYFGQGPAGGFGGGRAMPPTLPRQYYDQQFANAPPPPQPQPAAYTPQQQQVGPPQRLVPPQQPSTTTPPAGAPPQQGPSGGGPSPQQAQPPQVTDAWHPAQAGGGGMPPGWQQKQQEQDVTGPLGQVTDLTIKVEGGAPYRFYGGQDYDPATQPTMPGYYGFPQWSGVQVVDPTNGNINVTHAAGLGQFQPNTWRDAVNAMIGDGLASKSNPPDFRNPNDQMAVLRYWEEHQYRKFTGRDLNQDWVEGKFDPSAMAREWTGYGKYTLAGAPQQTAGETQAFKDHRANLEREEQIVKAESDQIAKILAEKDPLDPERSQMEHDYLQHIKRLNDIEEDKVLHPPTEKPRDMWQNFGSVATLIGILGGLFAHRPLVASLNAAASAMQAQNDRNDQQYQRAFETWKTQTGMLQNLISSENAAYRDVLADKQMAEQEKWNRIREISAIYDNQLSIYKLKDQQYEAWEKDQANREKMAMELEVLRAKIIEGQQNSAAYIQRMLYGGRGGGVNVAQDEKNRNIQSERDWFGWPPPTNFDDTVSKMRANTSADVSADQANWPQRWKDLARALTTDDALKTPYDSEIVKRFGVARTQPYAPMGGYPAQGQPDPNQQGQRPTPEFILQQGYTHGDKADALREIWKQAGYDPAQFDQAYQAIIYQQARAQGMSNDQVIALFRQFGYTDPKVTGRLFGEQDAINRARAMLSQGYYTRDQVKQWWVAQGQNPNDFDAVLPFQQFPGAAKSSGQPTPPTIAPPRQTPLPMTPFE